MFFIGKVGMLIGLIGSLLMGPGYAEVDFGMEMAATVSNSEGHRIYIQPNQVILSQNSIFVVVNNEKIFVNQLGCDESGLYFMSHFLNLPKKPTKERCTNNHTIWCKACSGCVFRYCRSRCKCVSWK